MEDNGLKDLFGELPSYTQLTFGNHKYDMEAEPGPDGQHPLKEAVAVFSFCEKGFGFGELTLVVDAQGQHYLDTESTNLKRVRELLLRVLDTAILDTDMDPEKHRRYNAQMGRTCGSDCPVCHPVSVSGRSSPSESAPEQASGQLAVPAQASEPDQP